MYLRNLDIYIFFYPSKDHVYILCFFLFKSNNQVQHNKSWLLKCYSKLGSNNENTILKPNTLMLVIFLNRSLNVFVNGKNEQIYIKPETYILNTTLHLGILSFDPCHCGKWVLSFLDEPSAMDCVQTLRSDGLKVINIQKLMTERMNIIENDVINTITNPEFPNFVANVENIMKK